MVVRVRRLVLFPVHNPKVLQEVYKGGQARSFFDDFPKGIGHGAAAFPEHWGPVVETYFADLGIDLEVASHSIQIQPDLTLSADAFVGKLETRIWGDSSLQRQDFESFLRWKGERQIQVRRI